MRQRYADGADRVAPDLCCPTDDYEPQYLEHLPQEILEKDYGCGNPSRYVEAGETALDLGSGVGKICYILAQKVGPQGRVIGLDFNDAMLAVARKYQEEMAQAFGFDNVAFHKARIQDMALNLDTAQKWLNANPITSIEDLSRFEAHCDELRNTEPLVADDFVDVVVSNCVLNLVRTEEKKQLFAEIFRVLRKGGRAVISDIVCDEDIPDDIRHDPDLWSGCIAGAFREDEFLNEFEQAGFHGIEIMARSDEPWQVIKGIEFRAMTVRAYKGKHGPCLERNQAVVYRGPWKEVRDDDGHILRRGRRLAVCDKTFHLMTDADSPYAQQVIPIVPSREVPAEQAQPFHCTGSAIRPPHVTKQGQDTRTIRNADAPCCCDDGGSCC